jgi:hypothetical protein
VGVDVEVDVKLGDAEYVLVGVLVGVNDDVETAIAGFAVLVGVLITRLPGFEYE